VGPTVGWKFWIRQNYISPAGIGTQDSQPVTPALYRHASSHKKCIYFTVMIGSFAKVDIQGICKRNGYSVEQETELLGIYLVVLKKRRHVSHSRVSRS
jgi:hypothetical protein